MYKTLVSIVVLFFSFFGSTAQVNKQLALALQAQPEKSQPVYIEFHNSLNIDSLGQVFNQKHLSSAQRTKILNRLLLRQSAKSQKKTLKLLAEAQIPQAQYRSFYILNAMVGQLPAPIILQLAKLPEVSAISWAKGQLELDAPREGNSARSKKLAAVGGIEPGLAAINAPAMWARGYTGRGRKVYIFDSGVWAEHPSFSHRYLGLRTAQKAAWFGLFSPVPSGALSSHGTHVLGTTAGLDTATADTIGVAFGSYWMANDLINASTAAALPPQAFLIAGFEWALNPDGDTSTTNDIPDVINNSWRWRDIIDTAQCGGFVPRLMNTIETAGIANVFSGGNTGPNNNGLNAPQRINTNLVNTFCVGSIDANQNFPYPISNFSTRGPSQCPGSGPLSLHPEVVAPGQNVRSAWGANGYNTISGTSMASPHVSGALLLLKEAFPLLTGKELMEALYFSALDMGPSGEDNTYGRGLIDVEAAFNLLSQSHTPINPNQIDYDVAISKVSAPQGSPLLCDSSFRPQIILTNLGRQAIPNLNLSVYRDGALLHNQTLNTPSLQGLKDTVVLNLPLNLSIPEGFHIWRFHVRSGFNEYDSINNNFYIRLERNAQANLAFTEDFEDSLSVWTVVNPDRGLGWDTATVNGWPSNTQAIGLYFSDYLPRESQYDDLLSARLFLDQNGGAASLAFDRAYQARGPIASLQDSLYVLVSTNCGQTYTTAYQKAGTSLSSVGSTGRNFSPTNRSDWDRDTVDLSAYLGQEITVAFRGVNRNGNNLFLDNISVYRGAWDPLSRQENALNAAVKAYPNPAQNFLVIESLEPLPQASPLAIFNSSGKKVWQGELSNERLELSLKNWPAGLYTLQALNGDGLSRVKFVVQR